MSEEYEDEGEQESIIPGDNDKPGPAQVASGTNTPPNQNAPDNMCHIVIQPGDGGDGNVNIEITAPVVG